MTMRLFHVKIAVKYRDDTSDIPVTCNHIVMSDTSFGALCNVINDWFVGGDEIIHDKTTVVALSCNTPAIEFRFLGFPGYATNKDNHLCKLHIHCE